MPTAQSARVSRCRIASCVDGNTGSRGFGGCGRIGHDRESFVNEVKAALLDPGPSIARSEAIRKESWGARVDELREHLATLG